MSSAHVIFVREARLPLSHDLTFLLAPLGEGGNQGNSNQEDHGRESQVTILHGNLWLNTVFSKPLESPFTPVEYLLALMPSKDAYRTLCLGAIAVGESYHHPPAGSEDIICSPMRFGLVCKHMLKCTAECVV
jgi:hypothetical protein